MNSVKAVIAVGSNLEDPLWQIEQARERIARLNGVTLEKSSLLVWTRPVGFEDQPDFLNGAFLIETQLGPQDLLRGLISIETSQGRLRLQKDGPRTLDLDLIFYGDEIIEEEGLAVPHPKMSERDFVLKPLLDIVPDWKHPVLQQSVQELYDKIKDNENSSLITKS